VSIIGRDLPDDGVPLSALRRGPRPVVTTARVIHARRAMQRAITTRIAVAHYASAGTIRGAAVRMGRCEEYVRDLLIAAGAHVPRRRCSPAPMGRR